MRAGYDEVVLLTGFPSFAARKMCDELLRERTFIHAIVTEAQREEAQIALDGFTLSERSRLHLLEGDPSAIDLGLSGAEWKTLAAEVDRIHHIPDVAPPGNDAKVVERAVVRATREVVELATACKGLRCLVFHSTALVSGDRTGNVLEEELEKGQSFRNPVEGAFVRAEKIVRAAMKTIPACVLRPTIILGDSRTGEVDRRTGPYFLILLIVTSPPDFPLPLPGKPETPLHLVPIDYVVRAARAVGRDPRAPGRTFHIGDPSPLGAKRVFELVAQAGGRRSRFIPANVTKALLRTPGIDRFARSPRAFIDALATPVSYSFASTSELLADTDVRCPPLESYVERLVEHVQSRLREKREAEVNDPLI